MNATIVEQSTPPQSEPTLQCMEVWGGNRPTSQTVRMQGLDIWIEAEPLHDDGGGDVHYISSCSTGRIIRILLADVAGHGEQASATASVLANLMRRHVNTFDQNRFVQDLSAEFGRRSERGEFATAVAATFFAPTRQLEVTNAGHPTPLIYRGSTGQWAPMDGPKLPPSQPANIPLGVIDTAGYYSREARLEDDDAVLFYSDALIEATRADGAHLEEAGLLEMVQRLDVRDPAVFVGQLRERVEAWRSGPLDDDQSMLLFRPNGVEADMSPAGRVRSMWTLCKGMVTAALRGQPIPTPRLGSYLEKTRR